MILSFQENYKINDFDIKIPKQKRKMNYSMDMKLNNLAGNSILTRPWKHWSTKLLCSKRKTFSKRKVLLNSHKWTYSELFCKIFDQKIAKNVQYIINYDYFVVRRPTNLQICLYAMLYNFESHKVSLAKVKKFKNVMEKIRPLDLRVVV